MKKTMIWLCICILLLLICNACDNTPESKTETLASTTEQATLSRQETNVSTENTQETTVSSLEIIYQNDQYSLSVKNGNGYINFADGNDEDDKNGSLPGSIEFANLAEMRQTFLSNSLHEDQEAILKTAFSKTQEGILLFGFDQLYQPICSDDIKQEVVSLSRNGYYFKMSNEQLFGTTSLGVMSKENYTYRFDNYYKPYEHILDLITITKQEEDLFNGVPCEIVEHEVLSSGKQFRTITFSVMDEDKTLYISILYRLENASNTSELMQSETLPYEVRIFGEMDNQYFYVRVENPTTPPTLEFLTSFGITPYTPPVEDTPVVDVPQVETQAPVVEQ